MNEMDRLTVDVSLELIERVEGRFLGPPIEPRPPVLAQLLQVRPAHPVPPLTPLELVDEARPFESLAEVDEGLLGHSDPVRRAQLHSDPHSAVAHLIGGEDQRFRVTFRAELDEVGSFG